MSTLGILHPVLVTFSKPYAGLGTAVSSVESTKKCKRFETLDNAKGANTVRTRLLLAVLCMLETLGKHM